jgi:large subunit ribosomal protein L6
MSRVAKQPVVVPKGVDIKVDGQRIAAKGAKGQLELSVHSSVEVALEDNTLKFSARGGSRTSTAMAGTMRALANNVVVGVSEGFERKLELVGVGYRAQAQGAKLNLTLGFSHPVVYQVPDGVTVETPTQTEILVKGADRQKVGQVSAEIRAYRPPEPYKGKGVRYADEQIVRKEAKKK